MQTQIFCQVGDYVDAQDSARKWYEAIVREVTPETVKVHYFGWGSRWDTDLPRKKGINPKVCMCNLLLFLFTHVSILWFFYDTLTILQHLQNHVS